MNKLLRWKTLANRLVVATLLALALGVALAPQHVPGLRLPHSASVVKAT